MEFQQGGGAPPQSAGMAPQGYGVPAAGMAPQGYGVPAAGMAPQGYGVPAQQGYEDDAEDIYDIADPEDMPAQQPYQYGNPPGPPPGPPPGMRPPIPSSMMMAPEPDNVSITTSLSFLLSALHCI